MRWKLLLPASALAALFALGLWSGLTVALYGTARELMRHQSAFRASLLVPSLMTVLATVFVYRHTARRRKTQAVLSALLTLLILVLGYLVLATVAPRKFPITRMPASRRSD